MLDTPHHCFSIRQLNPFRGVAQVIQLDNCRAVSADGAEWEIQVNIKQPDDLWGGESKETSVYRYIRFGTWSVARGLTQIPAHPFLNLTHMFDKANAVINCLESEVINIPFPLEDHFELWLFDAESRSPLALVQSATNVEQISLNTPSEISWIATETTEHHFPSNNPTKERQSQVSGLHGFNNIPSLNHIVRNRSSNQLTQWIKRLPDGSGEAYGPSNLTPMNANVIPSKLFPELMLKTDFKEKEHTQLIDDYLMWQAPRLLALQHISDETRTQLEQHAITQAVEVEKIWRLYPKTIDPDFLTTVRVEARLRATTAC